MGKTRAADKQYEGKPCKKCGGTARYKSDNKCVDCRSALNAQWREKNPGRTAEIAAAWRKANPETRAALDRAKNLRQYGITVEQYIALLDAQGGVCAICGSTCTTSRSLAVDHCHATGRVRGLLCQKCNMALGLLRDSPEIIGNALIYICDGGAPAVSTVVPSQQGPVQERIH